MEARTCNSDHQFIESNLHKNNGHEMHRTDDDPEEEEEAHDDDDDDGDDDDDDDGDDDDDDDVDGDDGRGLTCAPGQRSLAHLKPYRHLRSLAHLKSAPKKHLMHWLTCASQSLTCACGGLGVGS